MDQQGQIIDIVMGPSPKSTKGECGAGEEKSGPNMVLRKQKQGKSIGAGNLPSPISSVEGESGGQNVRELSAEENQAAYKEFRGFVGEVGARDRRRAEALRALWSVCVRWGVPVALRLGREVEEEEEEEEEEREREESVESVESVEDDSEEEGEVGGKRDEESAELLGRTQGLRLAALSGHATGAKMYLLLGRNCSVRKGKEWLWGMRHGATFQPMGREKVDKLLEYLDWKRGDKEEAEIAKVEKQDEEEIVKTGMKRKVTIILRTGSVFEKERTEEREKKRVRIFLRTWSEFETERMASIMAKEECSPPPESDSEDSSSDSDLEDGKTTRKTSVVSEEACYV